MGITKDFSRGKAEFHEPSPPESVIIGREVEHRRPGPPGTSPEEEAPHEAHLPPDQAHLPVRPPKPRGRSGRRPETYEVEVVRLSHVPVNRENPFAPVSASERYECVMHQLAEVWGAICRRREGVLKAPAERKLAA